MTSVDNAIIKASLELNLPHELVESVYKAYWVSIKETILQLPLKEIQSEEEFSKYITSFNIPSLGKLYSSFSILLGVRNRFLYLKKLLDNVKDKETKTNVY